MKILFLHGWHSVPGGVKPMYLKDAGHEVINPKLDDDDFDAAVRTAQAGFDQHRPDVIVGSSRGGAVAMNLNSRDTPLVLLCPAWKNWGTARKLKSNDVILHSRRDDVIPFEHSEQLILSSGLSDGALIEIGTDHRLAEAEPLKVMLKACEQHRIGASFAIDCPSVLHVIPLHLIKPVWKTKTLLSKAALQKAGNRIQRATSGEKDRVLGFHDLVHFYLPKCNDIEFSVLPILTAQLKKSAVDPFPHAVLEIPSSELRDRDCIVCNFNIALSKPKYEGGRGYGMHNRNASAESVLRHWRGFRASNPSRSALRRSYWHKGLEVPVIAGHHITLDPDAIGSGMSTRRMAGGKAIKIVELLLRSPFVIPESARLHVFSQFDAFSLQKFFTDLPVEVQEDAGFEWYREADRVSQTTRTIIEKYFSTDTGPPPELNYDAIR